MNLLTGILIIITFSMLNGQTKVDSEHLQEYINSFRERVERVQVPEIVEATKLDELKKFGFTSTQEVKRLNRYREIREQRDGILKYCDLYGSKYGRPFLTKAEIRRIAKKYGLLFAESKHFIGSIPEARQDDILEFEIEKNDLTGDRPEYHVMAEARYFDLRDKEIIDNVFIVEKDPIVFAKVNGGFIYVTHWGEDAIEPMKDILTEPVWADDELNNDYITLTWAPTTFSVDSIFVTDTPAQMWIDLSGNETDFTLDDN